MKPTARHARTALLLASLVALVACGKAAVSDDLRPLEGLDEKAEGFSSQVRVLGTIAYGETRAFTYTSTPRYRAFRFTGAPGDRVKVRVRSSNGDPVAWLTDATFRALAYNDDASARTTDAALEATLPANRVASRRTYYVVVREFYGRRATFSATVEGTSAPDLRACTVDSDCEKTYDGCCAISTWVAVRTGQADAYHRSLGCPAAPVCPRVAVRFDNTVPVCDGETRRCALMKPEDILCSGFRMPNLRACPTGYTCTTLLGDGDPLADAPGRCYQACGGVAGLTCEFPDYACVDHPRDECDPAAGARDCAGVCSPAAR